MSPTISHSTHEQNNQNQKELLFITNDTKRTPYLWFFGPLLIGALISGVVLGPVVTLYVKGLTTTTTTTTVTTSTSTSTTSTTSTTTTTTTMYPLVPPGVILLWSGSITMVPLGWAICDGTQGTPDLRDKFILGSGPSSLYTPNQTGGSATAAATITVGGTVLTVAQMPSHSHGGVTGSENNPTIYYDVSSATTGPLGPGQSRWTTTLGFDGSSGCQHNHAIPAEGGNQPHTHSASMTPINITPPFVALAYIMKL